MVYESPIVRCKSDGHIIELQRRNQRNHIIPRLGNLQSQLLHYIIPGKHDRQSLSKGDRIGLSIQAQPVDRRIRKTPDHLIKGIKVIQRKHRSADGHFRRISRIQDHVRPHARKDGRQYHIGACKFYIDPDAGFLGKAAVNQVFDHLRRVTPHRRPGFQLCLRLRLVVACYTDGVIICIKTCQEFFEFKYKGRPCGVFSRRKLTAGRLDLNVIHLQILLGRFVQPGTQRGNPGTQLAHVGCNLPLVRHHFLDHQCSLLQRGGVLRTTAVDFQNIVHQLLQYQLLTSKIPDHVRHNPAESIVAVWIRVRTGQFDQLHIIVVQAVHCLGYLAENICKRTFGSLKLQDIGLPFLKIKLEGGISIVERRSLPFLIIGELAVFRLCKGILSIDLQTSGSIHSPHSRLFIPKHNFIQSGSRTLKRVPNPLPGSKPFVSPDRIPVDQRRILGAGTRRCTVINGIYGIIGYGIRHFRLDLDGFRVGCFISLFLIFLQHFFIGYGILICIKCKVFDGNRLPDSLQSDGVLPCLHIEFQGHRVVAVRILYIVGFPHIIHLGLRAQLVAQRVLYKSVFSRFSFILVRPGLGDAKVLRLLIRRFSVQHEKPLNIVGAVAGSIVAETDGIKPGFRHVKRPGDASGRPDHQAIPALPGRRFHLGILRRLRIIAGIYHKALSRARGLLVVIPCLISLIGHQRVLILQLLQCHAGGRRFCVFLRGVGIRSEHRRHGSNQHQHAQRERQKLFGLSCFHMHSS